MGGHRVPGAGRPRLRVATTIAIAVALLLGIFALRASDPNVGDGEGILFVVPIGVLALRFGLRGGLTGALASFALMAVWDANHDHVPLTLLGYLNRGVAFIALGALLGVFVDRRSRLEAEVLHHYEASLDTQRKTQQQLANSARSLERKVAERTHEVDDARAETLQLLAVAVEYRDDDTFQHTERVGMLAAKIGTRLGLRATQVRQLREAAPLHDVGKIAIPDRILLQPGSLSEDERRAMQAHAALGARLLSRSSSPVLQMAAVIAATHHERWNGSGYPSGLAGERIPIVGRIVAVADVFDALTHERPYKPASPVEQAIARITRGAGSEFDPRVVAAFLEVHADAVGSTAERRAPDDGSHAVAAEELLRVAAEQPVRAFNPVAATRRARQPVRPAGG
jgi:HD-GYP domain-containing protein (c-di-GMP phosphodiesterase class II)